MLSDCENQIGGPSWTLSQLTFGMEKIIKTRLLTESRWTQVECRYGMTIVLSRITIAVVVK